MSDYMVLRKRKRYAVDPCLGFYLLPSGKVTSSLGSRSNNSLGFGFRALAACTGSRGDAPVPSSIENEREIEDICDASHNQHLEDLPDYGLQRTPESARQMQPENLGIEYPNSSINTPSDPTQPMMTVEDFLKRSNKGNGMVKKQYGKTKTRIKRLGDNDSALFEAERQHGILGSDSRNISQSYMQLRSKKIRRATTYESSSDESSSLNHKSSSPLKIKRKKNRGRTPKPLKERLYEAAVLTHGYPDDILVHDAITGSELAPSRRPLRFIPDTQPELDDSQMDKRRSRMWSFVDPRKSMAIRTASFSSKTQPHLQHIDSTSSGKTAKLSLQPPKRWKFGANLVYSSLSNVNSKKESKIPLVKASGYPPLTFVSLKEAEEEYKSMFSHVNHKRSGRLSDGCIASPLQMVSVAESASCVAGRISNPAVPTTYNKHMVPLEEVIQRPNFAVEASAQIAIDQIRTLDDLNYMPSVSFYSSPINDSISSPTTLALPVTPKSIQDWPITRIPPAHHRSLRVSDREHALIRRCPDVSPKPMRPLASLFDEFIQNIRNVAVSQDQPSVSNEHLGPKWRLRKASRTRGSPRQCGMGDMLPRPTETTTGGIFVSQQAWTNDLESIHQNDSKYRDHRQRTLNLPPNQRLSPDILTALEPQNYQVILSSPS